MPSKKFYTSKTFWFNVLALLVGVAGVFGFNEFVPSAEVEGQIAATGTLVAALVPIINIFLRFVTDTKITT